MKKQGVRWISSLEAMLKILFVGLSMLIFGVACTPSPRAGDQETATTLAASASNVADNGQNNQGKHTGTGLSASQIALLETTQTTSNPALVERTVPEMLAAAEAAFARKNYKEARPLLEEILLRQANNERASLMLATIFYEGNVSSAARIILLLDIAESALGKIPEAQWIRSALALSAKNFDLALASYQYLLEINGYKDRVFNKVLPVLEANARWRDLLNLTQNHQEQTKANARLFVYRANAFTQLGQGNQAVEALRIAARLDEQNKQVKTLLAQAFISIQNFSEGVRTLEDLVTTVPNTANYEKLAYCFEKLGRADDSYRAYIAASENNPLQTKAQIGKQLELLITVSQNRLKAGNRHLAMLHYQQAASFSVKNEELDKLGLQIFGNNPPAAR